MYGDLIFKGKVTGRLRPTRQGNRFSWHINGFVDFGVRHGIIGS